MTRTDRTDGPTFDELGVPAPIVKALAAQRILAPFPIQSESIPPALDGRDVCGKAPTGSGKTIAFGIPLAARCAAAERGRPTGLVLVPTRELADQVAGEIALLAAPIGLRTESFYGGVPINRDLRRLERPVDVVVACPGRLRDLIDRRALRLDAVEVAVVDEADHLADLGFLPEVKRLLDETPDGRQVLLFSATLDGDVDVLIKRYQDHPVHVEAGPTERVAPDVTHHFWTVDRDRRLDTTAAIAARFESVIIFCRTRHGADRVTQQLRRRDISCVAIHGSKSQKQREQAIEQFRAGNVRALIATDVAARGIHIDGVDGVIQFDIPADHKDYTHRSGRTGRAGAPGTVVTLVTPETLAPLKKFARDLPVPLQLEPADATRLGSVRPRDERPQPPAKTQAAPAKRPKNRSRSAAPKRGGSTGERGQAGEQGRSDAGDRGPVTAKADRAPGRATPASRPPRPRTRSANRSRPRRGGTG